MTDAAHATRLTDDQVREVLTLMGEADSVELKLSIPDSARWSALSALDLDPLDAQMRQVFFFDTPDLDLDRRGLVVRARRVQGRGDDTVVKLRPVEPATLPPDLRSRPEFVVEVDAMPGGFVCSGSYKGALERPAVREASLGRHPIRKLFSKPQRRFFGEHAPDGLGLDDLAVLGPITVMKLKLRPPEYGRRLVVEVWVYPDGSRLLELSTKCRPDEAFQVAAESRALLSGRGIDLGGSQQTKTRTALEFFAAELRDGNAAHHAT